MLDAVLKSLDRLGSKFRVVFFAQSTECNKPTLRMTVSFREIPNILIWWHKPSGTLAVKVGKGETVCQNIEQVDEMVEQLLEECG